MDLVECTNNSKRHPWEISKAECLIKEIKKYNTAKKILDVGCGDSFIDIKLLEYDKNIEQLYGIDINLENEFKEKNYIVVNEYKKLKGEKFNTILMFDVLEHIKNDKNFLFKKIIPLLEDNGKIIITVPAYQFLFSEHDRKLKHYRRYNIKQLKEVCKKSGLIITNYHYFYFSLLPLRLITKIFNKDNDISKWNYSYEHILTIIVKKILNFDYFICKKLSKFSVGLSLFAVIEKNFNKEVK